MADDKPLEDVGAEGAGASAEAAADKKKKKKKKPAAGDKEKPVTTADKGKDSKKEQPKRKGPSKKTIAAIQEALQKNKEEEERLEREEEEKERLREEAEKARQEKLRLEQEKKERKKQKEKERKERLKAEGKLLTAQQKLEKQRAQEYLESLKAQGVEVPSKDKVDKKPRLGTRIRNKKNTNQTERSTSVDEIAPQGSQEDLQEKDESPDEKSEKVEEEVIKDEWDQESTDDDEKEDDTSKENSAPEPLKKNSVPVVDTKRGRRSRTASGKSQESANGKNGEESGEETSESESESEEEEHAVETKREKAQRRIQKRQEENERARSLKQLRSPVVCVLGHVDTGKTKILDKLRRTHVQDGEAGGITQQIGATNVPIEAIKEQTKFVKNFADLELKLPGLLIIDTPGHESFSNLRSRGSSLCDIAILVVDIMHGLEPQTIESINLLKAKRTPFVVALNKIDRLYEWQATGAKKDIRDILQSQPKNTVMEFEKRANETIVQFAQEGLNTAILGQNPDPKTYITMVPTSATTGEGMGNLIALIVELSQTMIAKQLMFSKELLATVLEVKALPGLGTTIDLILLNGTLKEGDTLVLAGSDGPIVTQIRSLLTPQPMKELRVKNTYIEYKELNGAVGVKVAAKDLEKAIAGLNVLVANHPDEVEICVEEVTKELKTALSSFRLQERGVYVQASTLGSLEALLEFLRTSEIPYSGIRIGPVVKKDVMRASTMLEHDSKYAVILAFDVKIERDAQELADSVGVRIFQADIIYHLFDNFIAYRDELKAKQRDDFKHLAIFPCKVKILPQCIFKTRDPIIVGVMIELGILKEGTPLCVANPTTHEIVDVGIVSSIEFNHKPMESARKGQEVCIKIESTPGEAPKMLGRHFQDTDLLVSKITRESIDVCKEYFRTDLQKSDWQLMVELKKIFQIM